jgi:hypothetical protein
VKRLLATVFVYLLMAEIMSSLAAPTNSNIPEALLTWRPVRGSPGDHLASITYANGNFVGVGRRRVDRVEGTKIKTDYWGIVSFSKNGGTWSQDGPEDTGPLSEITYGNGKFVAVGGARLSGDGGSIATSVDGLSWKEQLATGAPVRGIAFGSGVFVAVSEVGSILTSSDGISWFAQELGVPLWGIGFAKGMFVAVGDNGGIVTSSDGFGWAIQDSPTTGTLTSITYGNNLFVAAGYQLTFDPVTPFYGLILTSEDAIEWKSYPVPTSGALLGIAFGKDTFVAVGTGPTGSDGAILTSGDGATWTEQGPFFEKNFNAVAFGDGGFVAVGNNGTVATSADGVFWRPFYHLHNITTGKGLLVATGLNGTIVTSSDGLNWTEQQSGTDKDLNEIVFAQGKFLTVGNDGIVLISTDATNWTVIDTGNTNELHGVAYDSRSQSFVAVGRTGTILNSADGISWTSSKSPKTTYLKSVAALDGDFKIVGEDITLLSGAGANWLTQSITYSAPLLKKVDLEDISIASPTGPLVIVGDSGVLLTSTNFSTWQAWQGAVVDDLRSVTFGHGFFVTVGNNGVILVSADGFQWNSPASATLNNLRAVTPFNQGFIAIGNNGTILQSGSLELSEPLRLAARNPPGNFGFPVTVSAETGRQYTLQASSDLKSWFDISTFNQDASSTQFNDKAAARLPRRFYRGVWR